jgi:Transmembrane amino acid transporter protein
MVLKAHYGEQHVTPIEKLQRAVEDTEDKVERERAAGKADGRPSDRTALNGIRDYAKYRFNTGGILAGLSATAFTVLLSLNDMSEINPPLYNELSRTLAAMALALATLVFTAVSLSGHSVVRIVESHLAEQDETRNIHEGVDGYEREVDGWITLGFLWLFVALCLMAFRINLLVGIVAIVWAWVLVASLPNLWGYVRCNRIFPVSAKVLTPFLVGWMLIAIVLYGLWYGPQLPALPGHLLGLLGPSAPAPNCPLPAPARGGTRPALASEMRWVSMSTSRCMTRGRSVR